MDSKIIAAIIIAVGFVAGVYIYTQDNPLNRCVSYWTDREIEYGKITKKAAIRSAKDICLNDQKYFID
jgi:hypothetical protein